MSISTDHPVQIFLVNQLNSIVRDTAIATELPEAAVLRAVSEIIRTEALEEHAAARVFVNRVAGARRRGRRVILLNGGDAVLCVRCGALTRNLTDAAKFRCARCHAFRGDVVDPDDGRAA